jgi:hypothetical protein
MNDSLTKTWWNQLLNSGAKKYPFSFRIFSQQARFLIIHRPVLAAHCSFQPMSSNTLIRRPPANFKALMISLGQVQVPRHLEGRFASELRHDRRAWVQQLEDTFSIVRTNLHAWLNILGPEANYILYEQNDVESRRHKSVEDSTLSWNVMEIRKMNMPSLEPRKL